MTSHLPHFRCLFLICQQQKEHKNGAAVTSLRSLFFRDNFSTVVRPRARQATQINNFSLGPKKFYVMKTLSCAIFWWSFHHRNINSSYTNFSYPSKCHHPIFERIIISCQVWDVVILVLIVLKKHVWLDDF